MPPSRTELLSPSWFRPFCCPVPTPSPSSFGWFSALGTAGFIIILILTSAAIIVFFASNGMIKSNPFATVVAPDFALCFMYVIAWLTLENYEVLGSGTTAKWLLLSIPIFAVAGLIRSLQKRSIDYSTDIF